MNDGGFGTTRMDLRSGVVTAGCCSDRSCTPETCMTLPRAQSCATCLHMERCVKLFGARPKNTICDFYPRRFEAHP